jgi:hypothetical protein
LLRNGGCTTRALPFQIFFGRDLDFSPIESIVLIETRVLRGDDSVLKIGRYLAERNELVALAIRRAVKPGLQSALYVHRGRRRIDPPVRHEHQSGLRPDKGREKQCANDDPRNKESKEARPCRRLCGHYGGLGHVPE